MKRRFTIYALVACLLLAGLLIWQGRKEPAEDSSARKSPAQTHEPSNKRQLSGPLGMILNAVAPSPVDFFGRVIDQSGNPVAAAEVNVTRHHPDESLRRFDTVTDHDGRFEVHDFDATSIKVYVLPPKGYRTAIGSKKEISIADVANAIGISEEIKAKAPRPYQSDPKNPMVFFLEKIGPADPLYFNRSSIALPPDGTPVRVSMDFARFEKVLPQDLPPANYPGHVVEFSMTARQDDFVEPANPVHYRRHFPWTFQIRVPDGQILPIELPKDPYGRKWIGEIPPEDRGKEPDLMAPEEGYRESLTFDYPKELEPGVWDITETGECFVRFNDGTYGRIHFRAIASGAMAAIETYYNPSGGRNTLFDNSKVIPMIKR